MSLKPPKKSDLKKPWMNKPDRAIKIRPEYHLIVTEGTDTEPAYFGAIQEIINKQYPEKIQLKVFGVGDNTVSLFEKAKQLAKENPNGYRHVWIVYDTDDFPAAHIDRVVQLCVESSTEEIEYHAVWSNQCIELWFYAVRYSSKRVLAEIIRMLKENRCRRICKESYRYVSYSASVYGYGNS